MGSTFWFHVLMERMGWLRIDKFWFIVSTFPRFHPFVCISTFSHSVSTLFFPVFHPSLPTKPSTHSFIHSQTVSLTAPRENRGGQIARSSLRFAAARSQMHPQLLLRLRYAQRRALAIHPDGRRDHPSGRHHHHGTPFLRFADARRALGSWWSAWGVRWSWTRTGFGAFCRTVFRSRSNGRRRTERSFRWRTRARC